MLKSFGSSYCILGIGLVVFSKGYTDRSLDLIRGKFRDKFVNPFCTNGSCVVASCEKYNAVCGSNGCKYCVCNKDNHSTTYFPSKEGNYGQCIQDSVLARNSGCFNQSIGGKAMYILNTNIDKLHNIEKVRIGFYPSSKTRCKLWWAGSSFSINNQYWKPTTDFINDFSLSFNVSANTRRPLYVKVNIQAYKRWTGAVLKLKFQCYTQENNQPRHNEDFCTVFKFTGYYRAYQIAPVTVETLVSPNTTKNSTDVSTSGRKTMPRPGDQYLASTIALSGILSLVFMFLGFGIFLLLRSQKRHDSEEATTETDLGTTHQEHELQLRV
ncbi:uncharacterized protein LOC114533529 [Dendronephthya gigantea]|uniref:uncharacterized protein LOC114533529 n=1 Tax=Dendronephthya gigantea TaxID=151771 RepID=UPI00106B9A02|nr:uncharacterized protein LOC114533529 [Dendronephthya gigantea]